MMRLTTAGSLLAATVGVAIAGTGAPSDWQMNMQGQVTELGRGVRSFHDLLLWIITIICLLVGVLLAIVIFRFREDKNPVPARTTHNTLLEVAWTVAPVAILVAIAIPSFRLLREQP